MTTENLDALREVIRDNMIVDEDAAVRRLIGETALDAEARRQISKNGADLVRAVRGSSEPKLMESFLAEYGLSTAEGVALMCLAEALLRVPDAETIDELIADKIVPHDWSSHSGGSASMFVNASTWALMLTGRVLEEGDGPVEATLFGMIRRLGEPVIRTAVGAAMREMGDQFVLGRSIDEAVKRGRATTRKGYCYSYDMLGEAARTGADAARYFEAYRQAIRALKRTADSDDIRTNPGISVKLSALDPRYEESQRGRVVPDLSARLLELCQEARDARMGLNIDAEEADRLDLSLDVIETVLADPSLAGWDGFGVVVQAYGPRAPFAIDWLYALAGRLGRRVMVRLVKGAYWDTEIKRAQVFGLQGFPVFTRKCNTDVSYLACARKLLGLTDRIYPQFATHNAHTVAAILAMTDDRSSFEFQRLHGMGDALHEAVRQAEGTRCRIYAPVGAHEDLLAYLVRRLLENGANSSFVHQIVDEAVSAEEIARDPVAEAEGHDSAANPAIRRPHALFGAARDNSRGWDLFDRRALGEIDAGRSPFAAPHRWRAAPVPAPAKAGKARIVVNPADPDEVVGEVVEADATLVERAVDRAVGAQPGWAATPVADRAAVLRRIADLYERHAVEFFALATREAGKTLADGVAEVREAVDFLRYYAARAPEAERDTAARGVIACISPWNFPLAIFTGQIAAALVTGNAVIAKPAEQTPLIAARAASLMLEAGVPEHVIQLLPGDGPSVGAPLTADPRIAGVCFTGSTEVARRIEAQLAETAEPDAMLIAETGGLNAMIVDSTALPEQAVRDIVASSFQSAGQRCSALRILYVQKDVEAKVLTMLRGAMRALAVGDPWLLSSDVGPVIDGEAQSGISAYCAAAGKAGRVIERLDAPGNGRFVAPHILKVGGIADVEREVFGPVLHVATFEADDIDGVIDAVNARGYGLTFGLHTRIESRVQHIVDRVRAGNIYVNRNQIGAVVGSQPFGGEGLSGTGPKAGGPHYLPRFRKSMTDTTEPEGGDEPVAAMPKRFADASAWAVRADRIAVLRKALRGRASQAVAAAAALDFGPVDLPGPTGEANSLALHPRGNALCLGPGADCLLDQVALALAAGNSVIAAAPGAKAALGALASARDLPLIVIDGAVDDGALKTLPVDVVAYSGSADRMRAIRRILAGRDGPIVRLVSERLAAEAYVHERAVCVDTTAAGGNASLLAGAG
ncbi:MAG: bifunctional proline dehydrogenase/L-glutamate gamma-semialdehyde dehydrogenase PutA [Rhizobiaceae bacterium]